MDIHKPRPWHGVRELLKEIGTIVIGVLIALGAEQAVETMHTRHLIAEAEDAMRAELVDDDLPQAYARLAITPCLQGRLQALRAAVAQRMDQSAFNALARDYAPPQRTWESDAWRATSNSVAGARMESKRLLAWSSAYTMTPFLQTDAVQERQGLQDLQRTRFSRGPWTAARVDELDDTVDRLQDVNEAIAGESLAFLAHAKAAGAALSPAVQDGLVAEARKAYGACAVTPNLTLGVLQTQLPTGEERHRIARSIGARER